MSNVKTPTNVSEVAKDPLYMLHRVNVAIETLNSAKGRKGKQRAREAYDSAATAFLSDDMPFLAKLVENRRDKMLVKNGATYNVVECVPLVALQKEHAKVETVVLKDSGFGEVSKFLKDMGINPATTVLKTEMEVSENIFAHVCGMFCNEDLGRQADHLKLINNIVPNNSPDVLLKVSYEGKCVGYVMDYIKYMDVGQLEPKDKLKALESLLGVVEKLHENGLLVGDLKLSKRNGKTNYESLENMLVSLDNGKINTHVIDPIGYRTAPEKVPEGVQEEREQLENDIWKILGHMGSVLRQ